MKDESLELSPGEIIMAAKRDIAADYNAMKEHDGQRYTGIRDVIVTPDEGGGPLVVVLRGGTFQQIRSFLAIEDANFRGGARAAMADVNADGRADLIVSAGLGPPWPM